ncbi:amidohydrolase family protein [Levilactobacillus zymae]|uniref:amidohydrolase family protein n=1 Tax=Levilactobacillus zymae TaxID=267363 RepID=UPI002353D820|nr:amidohydrolase family protein [Levilactobacillus zymae]
MNSASDVRRAVRENFKLGAGNIKVMATGGVMSADDEVDDTELTEEEIRVAVQEAHSKHMTVASHAQGNRGIQLSLEAGVDSIEHGIYIDADQIQLMKDQGTYLVRRLVPATRSTVTAKASCRITSTARTPASRKSFTRTCASP